MLTIKFRAVSNTKMSNTKYHRLGKPSWWCRFEVGGESVFARIDDGGGIRGDAYLDRDAEITLPGPGDYRVHTGVGPRDGGIRETDILRVHADGTSEWNPALAPKGETVKG